MTFTGNSRRSRCCQAWKFFLLAVPLWLCTLVAAQAPIFVSFETPHAGLGQGQGTLPTAINRNGTITGYYYDSQNGIHAFVRQANGQITEFDAPGVSSTHAFAINAAGQIVGFGLEGSLASHAFLRLANGAFRRIDFPGAANTSANGINDSGAIIGNYGDSANVWHGFVRDWSGTYTSFDAPNANTQGPTPVAIDASGTIAGYYYDSSFQSHGFVRDPSGNLTEFDAPGPQTLSVGIDGNGDVIGTYFDGMYHSFLRDTAGNFTTINVPNATGTTATGVNDQGVIVGFVEKPNGRSFTGFRRDSSGNFTIVSAPAPNNGTAPVSIDTKGRITGWYYDTNFARHGFMQ